MNVDLSHQKYIIFPLTNQSGRSIGNVVQGGIATLNFKLPLAAKNILR
jgi:hypothetical protein